MEEHPKTTFNNSVMTVHILVVDDNEINRMLAKKLLHKFNFNVVTVDSGLKAIELLKAKNFDIVLMDIHMPGMSGYETAQTLRKMDDIYFKEVPIIALTASIMMDELEVIRDFGITDYQIKPYKPEELFQKMIKYLK